MGCSKQRLLIIDDSKYIADRLADRVVQGGVFQPVVAYNFKEASELLASDTGFFAAIVDLMLPDCDDGDAVRLTISKNIPTIVLTGSMDESLREMIVGLPIVDFLFKSTQEDIYSAVSLAEELFSFSGRKALIVDTSQTRKKYLTKLFRELLFEVIFVETAQEAFDQLLAVEGIDIVTVNNERSDMTGPELVKFIRHDPKIRHSMKNKGVVVFGISVDSSEYLRSRFIKSGANDLLTLPITKEEFNAKIINNLNMVRTVHELKDKNEELKQTIRILEEYNKAVDAGGIVSKSDLEGNITYVNEAFCKMTGYTEEEMIGKPHSLFRHPNTPKSVFKDLWDTIEAGRVWMGNVKNVRKNGTVYYVTTTIVPIVGSDGKIIEYVAIRHDITELVKSRHELKSQFMTDALTSLSNRMKMLEDLKTVENPMLAVFDIDRFKEINGFYGHKVGDEVLKQLANRIFNMFSDHMFEVYRINSDQFAVLTSEDKINSQTFESKVKHLLDATRRTHIKIDEIEVDINLTICIVDESEDILNKVDMALKNAKQTKRDIVVYNETQISETEAFKSNIMWTKVIKSAIKSDSIVPYFQPIVNNQTGKVEKYEALMRMVYNKKLISPGFFLNVAKKTKYYPYLTDAMIKKCFEIFSKNINMLSINLSVEDISNRDTVDNLYEMLEAYMIGDRITFEIVESEGIENYDEVEGFVSKVKEKGCRVAIDDFGSGYSNFEYLMKLKADYIKIDGSIIKNICTDKSAQAVTEAIVNFAQKNNMLTVAEFVSDETIQNKVTELGINALTRSVTTVSGKPISSTSTFISNGFTELLITTS
jgi:PAS domain S-box-containing protein/diguanylate cyclase (GGDEF)-like protein